MVTCCAPLRSSSGPRPTPGLRAAPAAALTLSCPDSACSLPCCLHSRSGPCSAGAGAPCPSWPSASQLSWPRLSWVCSWFSEFSIFPSKVVAGAPSLALPGLRCVRGGPSSVDILSSRNNLCLSCWSCGRRTAHHSRCNPVSSLSSHGPPCSACRRLSGREIGGALTSPLTRLSWT